MDIARIDIARIDIAKWWSRRPGVERFDLSTRAPLYLLSALEPVVLILLLQAEQALGPPWALTLLGALTLAHTIACVLVLRAGLAQRLGDPGPRTALVWTALGLTVAGLAAVPPALPGYGRLLGSDGLPLGFAVTLLLCAAFTAALTPMLTGRQLVAVILLPALGFGVLQLVLDASEQAAWTLNYLFLVGALAVTYRSSAWVLGLVWEIDRGREAQARLAVAEERLRLARDLHDVLGRNLTLIAVHSELAASLVRRDPDEAVRRMLDVRQAAQDSMREVGEVVGGRRTTDLDAELAGARGVLRSAGIDARVLGDGGDLPASVQTALGWAVREASTNILRHADPTGVTIDLDSVVDPTLGPVARLRIENDGVRPGRRATIDGHGTGLDGLRERMARSGGELTAEALPHGRYRLEARLPITSSPGTAEEATP